MTTGKDAVERRCSFDGCDAPALVLSAPPACLRHVADFDQWYEHLQEVLRSAPYELPSCLTSPFGKELYRESLFRLPEAAELYADFKKRVDASEDVQFYFVDAVYFALMAAAAGVIGNASYAVVKGLLKKMTCSDGQLSGWFMRVVRIEKYEEIRLRVHEGGRPRSGAARELEVTLKRKHRLLFEESDARRQPRSPKKHSRPQARGKRTRRG